MYSKFIQKKMGFSWALTRKTAAEVAYIERIKCVKEKVIHDT